MKNKLLSLILLLTTLACAASSSTPAIADCTTQTFTAPNSEYYVQPGDCILRAQASSFGYIRFRLPTDPQIGDTYTFQENGPYETENYEYYDEEYQEWVSGDDTYTGGMGVLSQTSALVGNASEDWIVRNGVQSTVTFDGTNWVETLSTFTP